MCCCLLFQHVSVLCRYLFIASLCSLISWGCGLLPNMLNCRPCGYSTRSDPAFKGRFWGINSSQSGKWRKFQFSCHSSLQGIFFQIYTNITNYHFKIVSVYIKLCVLHLKIHIIYFKCM